jgi:CheY-like chemotaxis protein
MSENMTDKIRREVMRKYLRTLVWIDDQIHPDKTDPIGDEFRSFFYPTAQELQRKELLVHLHPYAADTSSDENDIFSDESKSLESAVRLAKKADVIILDWHLGRDDPKNSIELLNKLKDEPAIRYIIVLSRYAERFEKEMEAGKMLDDEPGSSAKSHAFLNIGDAWANDQGTHIIVMPKPDKKTYSAVTFSDSVIEAIYNLMAKANSDYLHWAAIEIAAKLRHSVPMWIQGIPRETDAAVLSEMLSENTEARTFIPEHLLEDLSHLAKLNVLDSLNSKNCKPEDWTNNPHISDSSSCGSETESHYNFVSLNSSISGISEDAIVKMRVDSESGACSNFIKSQEQFAQFCESISRHIDQSPSFGAVYEQSKKAEGGEKPKIFICISQECDCLRGFNLLFLKGKESKPGSSGPGATKLLFQGKEYEFTARPEDIKSYKVDSKRSIKELNKVGQLRDATARRILSRFWNHLSRAAVNLPTFARIERAENKTSSNKNEDCN